MKTSALELVDEEVLFSGFVRRSLLVCLFAFFLSDVAVICHCFLSLYVSVPIELLHLDFSFLLGPFSFPSARLGRINIFGSIACSTERRSARCK